MILSQAPALVSDCEKIIIQEMRLERSKAGSMEGWDIEAIKDIQEAIRVARRTLAKTTMEVSELAK